MLKSVLLGLLLVAVSAAPNEQACVPPHDTFTFCDTTLSLDERVANLVSQLTVAEMQTVSGNNAGAISRLGIPSFGWWSEALHGVNSGCYNNGSVSRCPTSFPTAQNLAATFNEKLIHSVGVAISDEARAAYGNGVTTSGHLFGPVVWTPNINIFRDPRWGRGQETPGEDPYLSGRYAVNMVTGLQDSGDERYFKLAATAKHFAAYSLEQFGSVSRHTFSANVTAQDLQQTFYPAFKAAVMEGNVQGIMCSYNSIDGVPSCANKPMLTQTLRDTWGFDGYVTGDCAAVQDVYSSHKYVANAEQATAVSVQAGTDTDCGSVFQANLYKAYNDSLITKADLVTEMTHLYTQLFRLGLFDPYENQPYAKLAPTVINSDANRALARDSADESIVLLKNQNNLLPLKAGTSTAPLKVAIIGPHITSTTELCSNYHGSLPHVVSIQEAFNSLTGVSVTYAQGCDFTSSSTSGFAAAETAAQNADVAVIAVGITQSQEAEGRDRTSVAMPGVQDQLVAAILAVQPKTVVVLVNGGMVTMDTVNKAPALLEAYYPGEEGGNSVVDVLFGEYNPSGRLPTTIFPAEFISQSDFLNYDMRKAPGLTYRFYQNTPVYEFGHGLSYTTFSYKMLTGTQKVPADVTATAQFQVQVTNTGALEGDVSVLGFVALTSLSTNAKQALRDRLRHDAVGARQLVHTDCPLKQLFEFQKVTLAAGASTTLTFTVTPGGAYCVDSTGTFYARTGTYTVTLGEATGTLIVQ